MSYFYKFAIDGLHGAPTIYVSAQIRNLKGGHRPLGVISFIHPLLSLLLHNMCVEPPCRFHLAKHYVVDFHFFRFGDRYVGALIAAGSLRIERPTRASVGHGLATLKPLLDDCISSFSEHHLHRAIVWTYGPIWIVWADYEPVWTNVHLVSMSP